MEKNYVTVVYDRRKRVDVTGMGKVELHIYFNRRERKYICVNECNPIAWRKYQKSEELANEISLYEKIIQRIYQKEAIFIQCGCVVTWFTISTFDILTLLNITTS